jgi:ribosomal protein L11 methyltransferase
MAHQLVVHLAPGGTAVLSGLLPAQAHVILAAHRRDGLVLERRIDDGSWTTLLVRAACEPQPRRRRLAPRLGILDDV